MRFHILTLFPEAFAGPAHYSLMGRAIRRGLVSVIVSDIRAYTSDAHGTADDYQFGGGPGMVMKPEPIFAAAAEALAGYSPEQRATIPIILLSPQGQMLSQSLVSELSQAPALTLICGHYAGVDERVRLGLATHDISIGDYVLTGGELAAMVVMDAVSRFIPGVVGTQENVQEDSITSGLLQHPLYTRPAEYRGMAAPEILRSGHHAQIEKWRRQESLRRTLARRPDLLTTAALSSADRQYLAGLGYSPAGPDTDATAPDTDAAGPDCPDA